MYQQFGKNGSFRRYREGLLSKLFKGDKISMAKVLVLLSKG